MEEWRQSHLMSYFAMILPLSHQDTVKPHLYFPCTSPVHHSSRTEPRSRCSRCRQSTRHPPHHCLLPSLPRPEGSPGEGLGVVLWPRPWPPVQPAVCNNDEALTQCPSPCQRITTVTDDFSAGHRTGHHPKGHWLKPMAKEHVHIPHPKPAARGAAGGPWSLPPRGRHRIGGRRKGRCLGGRTRTAGGAPTRGRSGVEHVWRSDHLGDASRRPKE